MRRLDSTMTLDAQLSIGRVSADVDTIKVTVTDGLSGRDALRLTLTPEQFALALTGQSYRPARAEWQIAQLGRARETKTEDVPVSGRVVDEYAKARLLAPFEVDGWMGRHSDLGNHHRSTEAGYRVSFVRSAERYEGEREDLEVLRRFALDCPGDYAKGQSPEIAAVLQAVESYFIRGHNA